MAKSLKLLSGLYQGGRIEPYLALKNNIIFHSYVYHRRGATQTYACFVIPVAEWRPGLISRHFGRIPTVINAKDEQ